MRLHWFRQSGSGVGCVGQSGLGYCSGGNSMRQSGSGDCLGEGSINCVAGCCRHLQAWSLSSDIVIFPGNVWNKLFLFKSVEKCNIHMYRVRYHSGYLFFFWPASLLSYIPASSFREFEVYLVIFGGQRVPFFPGGFLYSNSLYYCMICLSYCREIRHQVGWWNLSSS